MDEGAVARILEQQGINTVSLSHFCDTRAGPFFMLAIPGSEAVGIWHAFRELAPSTGYWPVISPPLSTIGYDSRAIENLIAYLQSDNVDRVLTAADAIDPVAWLENRLAEDAAIVEEEGDDVEEYRAELQGVWPDDLSPRTWFTVPDAASIELHLVPTAVPWEVPAFYRYGGTSTPRPEEHVALQRYWNVHHGAAMISYRGDLIEMAVIHPPQLPAEALSLAWKHYGYCPDVVVQGTGTVAALAATLLHGTAWYFWWD